MVRSSPALFVAFAFALVVAALRPEPCAAESVNRYNPHTGRWSYVPEGSSPRYNAFERTWEMAPKDWKPTYNPHAREWKIAPPGSSPRYNAFERTWEVAPKDWKPTYNPYAREWKIAPPGAKPRYNAFEREWELAP